MADDNDFLSPSAIDNKLFGSQISSRLAFSPRPTSKTSTELSWVRFFAALPSLIISAADRQLSFSDSTTGGINKGNRKGHRFTQSSTGKR